MSDDREPMRPMHPSLRLDAILEELQQQVGAAVALRDRMRQLLDAAVAIGSGLDLDEVLRRLLHAAAELVQARYGALGVLPDEGPGLEAFLHQGMDEDTVKAIGPHPHGKGLLGVLMREGRPLRLRELSSHPESYGFPEHHPVMHSFLGVPILVRGTVFGTIYLTEKIDADEFDEADESVVVTLAAAAGVAIENARLSSDARQLAVYEDRDRIARNLHDLVIQRLFATGMQLQSIQPLIGVDPPEVRRRLNGAVGDIDDTIREIRSTIYALQQPTDREAGLRDRILHVVNEQAANLGFEPTVTFAGLVDTVVPEAISGHLLAVVREALANVVKHAQAHSATVALVVSDTVSLDVHDDGVGLPARLDRRSGLANLASRADRLGGWFDATSSDGEGTRLHWQVPLEVNGQG